jgi:hypothetical protein
MDSFDMLQYWMMREAAYPNFCKVAKKHLVVCASSTPSERFYSQARLFIPYMRNRLNPTHLVPVCYCGQ